jgi:hypothetical protein
MHIVTLQPNGICRCVRKLFTIHTSIKVHNNSIHNYVKVCMSVLWSYYFGKCHTNSIILKLNLFSSAVVNAD